jgi:hypothetical protein
MIATSLSVGARVFLVLAAAHPLAARAQTAAPVAAPKAAKPPTPAALTPPPMYAPLPLPPQAAPTGAPREVALTPLATPVTAAPAQPAARPQPAARSQPAAPPQARAVAQTPSPPQVTPPPAPTVNPYVPPQAPVMPPPALSPPPAPPPMYRQDAPEMLLSDDVHHGGYGAPTIGFTTINGDGALMMGGRGGWLINHRLVLGGGIAGIASRIAVPPGSTPRDADHQIKLGYAGFWAEYIIAPNSPIHGSVGVLVGGGSLAYHQFRPAMERVDTLTDAVFIVEPTLGIELNLATFMRLGLFANYRLAADVDLPGLARPEVSSFGGGGVIKFGAF